MNHATGFLIAASLTSIAVRVGNQPLLANRTVGSSARLGVPGPVDVGALLAAAHGAPPVVCALAARSVNNGGWGRWADAPATPLVPVEFADDRDEGTRELSVSDQDLLLAGLASDDACVRELSVRVLGRQREEKQSGARIASALESRLGSTDPSLRAIAAFGLGLLEPQSAVDPLIKALRDGTPAVRGNAAWALGHLENGRALAPLVALLRDEDVTVREAAAGAVGRLDSTSAVPALKRVLEQDPSASVRRVAAWALGNLEARDAADVLAAALGKDSDARVREMSAWALGNVEAKSSGPALVMALKRDEDDRVREMAAWALGQIEDRAALEALGAAAGSDHYARVRGTAAWAIGQLDEEGGRAPAGLLLVLKDQNDQVRLQGAWALGQVGDSAALPAIQTALNVETNAEVRRALVRALIKCGGRSEQTLSALLTSSDPSVREAAVRGLAGRDAFGPWPWPEPRPRPFP
jgi:HEAT repeat protein